MNQELVQAIRARNAILFVGAGVSQYLKIPGYADLISHLAAELGFDPDIFQTQGDFRVLAEYYEIEKGGIGALRSWMDKMFHPTSIEIAKSEVHQNIVGLGCPVIYTTNYDNWLERAHDVWSRKYVKIASVSDLVNARDGATQIVKFHGDFAEDKSIVLTESSYFDRMSFESALDIKLRSDLLGRTVLFIGHSLTDPNVRYMLHRLSIQWSNAAQGDVRPKSFIFLTRPNAVQERVLSNRGIHAVVSSNDDPGAGLREFLRDLIHEAYGKA